jgi:hypothetical protein
VLCELLELILPDAVIAGGAVDQHDARPRPSLQYSEFLVSTYPVNTPFIANLPEVLSSQGPSPGRVRAAAPVEASAMLDITDGGGVLHRSGKSTILRSSPWRRSRRRLPS